MRPDGICEATSSLADSKPICTTDGRGSGSALRDRSTACKALGMLSTNSQPLVLALAIAAISCGGTTLVDDPVTSTTSSSSSSLEQ